MLHTKKAGQYNVYAKQQIGNLLRRNNILLEDLKQVYATNAMVNVMISCSDRYQLHNGPAKDDLYKNLTSGDTSLSIRKKIDYFDSYWQLQLEQYYLFCEGLIMPKIYEYWLHCRVKDWNIAEVVKSELKKQRIVEKDTKKLIEMDDEQRAADMEQRLYRAGWMRAKKYIPDKEFVRKMDDVMQEAKEQSIQTMLGSKKS